MKLASAYDPKKYESDIYALWEKSGVFKADPTSQKPRFSISMPPPNETGTLHAGHVIGLTLQDVMCRHARQQGKDVLWLPGTDHAALATNAIIEKKLAEQGTNKHELGREKFIQTVREFVNSSRDSMNGQIRAMGASCDWSRARYTLDDTLNRCVNEVFAKMYNDGLIYRGNRIVNWDPNLETTVSDDEVIHQEEKSPLYTLQFGPFQISTARPETKFGDKYVVMHPDDERYTEFRAGDTFETEWINGKITATVVKDEAVDPAFGTGVMTITPWHDHTDFEIAERHGLEKDQIIDFNGQLLPIAGEFAGMKIADARPKIVEKLQAKGLVVAIDEHYSHNLALNDRGKGIIEPQIKLQWFVDVNRPVVNWKGRLMSLKQVMRAVIDDKDVRLNPARFDKVYFHWIDNLRDWCISRQIWWGHQVPVWYKDDEKYVGVEPPEGAGWQQDPDTLDTWFSSSLWTWSTLVDQDLAKDQSLSLDELLQRSQDFKTYHPTSVLETGWDILFFWVARMVLSTTYTVGQVPFGQVYLHGLVRTESGKKMSKSEPEGSIDPTSVIAEYGADALRQALISGTAPGADQRLGRGKIVAGRNFNNKLWNIARYVEANSPQELNTPPVPKTIADHWILNKLSNSETGINQDLDNFRFSEAYDRLYRFVWDDLADWYIEASKSDPNPGILAFNLKAVLLMAHPFAPFVTEAIWQTLAWEKNSLLATLSARPIPKFDSEEAKGFETIIGLVTAARSVLKALQTSKPSLFYDNEPLVAKNAKLIARLARLGDVRPSSLGQGLKLAVTGLNVWLDIDKSKAAAYAKQLATQKHQAQITLKRLADRLANKDYAAKAPAKLIEQTRQQLTEQQSLIANISSEIKTFESY